MGTKTERVGTSSVMVGMGAVVASVATVATVATVASGVVLFVFFVTGANTTVTAVVDTCPALEARRVGASKGDTAIPLVHRAPILVGSCERFLRRLLRKPGRPLPRRHVIGQAVRLVLMRHFGPQRVVRIRVRQKRQNRQQNLGNGQRRRPLALENVQANQPIGVDVRVVDFRREIHLGGLKGIVGGKVNHDVEDSAGKGAVFGPHHHAGPLEEVLVGFGTATAARGGVVRNVGQFFLDSSECHCRVPCMPGG